MVDAQTKKSLSQLPLLTVNAGPRDGDQWIARLKEEMTALITYIKNNKETDNDWFTIESNPTGTRWDGKCWTFVDGLKYEFDLTFEIPVTYPTTNMDLCLPELDGKTAKMYKGAKICLTIHFQPLWQRNAPKFGIAHALALGLAPWLAAEIPIMIAEGKIVHPSKAGGGGASAGSS